jgi:hypothetical protein
VSRPHPLVWPAIIVLLAAVVYFVRVQKEMVDFKVYRTAAARAIAGEPLYRAADGHYQFKYLPAFAFAMTPFAGLDEEAGKVIWFAMSVGLLSALIRWAVRALPERRRPETALVWLSILLMGKFYAHELNLGQTNILLGTLLIGALLAAQTDLRGATGALVALGVFVKIYAIVLLPWLVLVAGIPGLLVFLGVLIVGLAMPAAVYGWAGNLDQLSGWYHTVTSTSAPNLLMPENISFATMWAKWLGPGDVSARLALVTGLAALLFAAWVMRRRKGLYDPGYLEFGLLMLLVPLLSPQGWDYVLLLATPAIVCLVDRVAEMSRAWRLVTWSAIAVMSFTIFDLLGRALYTRLMALSVVTVAVCVLAASLGYLRWRELA